MDRTKPLSSVLLTVELDSPVKIENGRLKLGFYYFTHEPKDFYRNENFILSRFLQPFKKTSTNVFFLIYRGFFEGDKKPR